MQNLPFDWSHTHSKKGALASKWSTIFHTTIFGRGTKLPTILRFLDKFVWIETNLSSSPMFEKQEFVWKIVSMILHLISLINPKMFTTI